MAPSTTMISNTQDQLFQSLLPKTITTGKSRKYKDAFGRRIKYHNYGRTNQFEVIEKLDGLEEKFQILNRDDLSDALRVRRSELRAHENERRFLPDVLDLLLRLSVDPTNIHRSDRLIVAKESQSELPPLRWADIEENDPINHNDPIWQNPDYSDLSSDDDGFEIFDNGKSSQTKKQINTENYEQSIDTPILFLRNEISLDSIQEQFGEEMEDGAIALTELQAARESLFMLQGLPTNLFSSSQTRYDINTRYMLRNVHQEMFWEALRSFAQIGKSVEFVRSRLQKPRLTQYSRTLCQSIADVVLSFDAGVAKQQALLIKPENTAHVGLVPCLEVVSRLFQDVSIIENYLRMCESKNPDSIGQLEVLFDFICSTQAAGNVADSTILLKLFTPAFAVYLKPIMYWIDHGELHENLEQFFIAPNEQQRNLTNLWEGWFSLQDETGPQRVPSFIKEFSKEILAVGKTTLFLRLIDASDHASGIPRQSPLSVEEWHNALQSSYMSFAEIFAESFRSTIMPILGETSATLYHHLDQKCGLWAALDAFSCIYFGSHGPITDNIETIIFRRLDKCNTAWSDRYLLTDLYASAFTSVPDLDTARLAIHSSHTSSRSLTTRRKSVKILGDLSVDYKLPWPLANILPQSSFASYRRIALLLMQLRRSRHALTRRAHLPIMNPRLGSSRNEQYTSQALYQKLLLFTHILYNHLTTLVIDSSISTMKDRMREASSVDEMTRVHANYAVELEKACLTAKKLTPIRDAVISILDLAIRLADIVATPTPIGGDDDEDEVRSYHSAASRRRRWRRRREQDDDSADEEEEDDEDDDEISSGDEGYSTFIVLDEPSLTAEFKRMDREFERLVAFIVAGLRSLGRVGGGGGGGGGGSSEFNSWEVLAARLDWKMKEDL